MDRILLLCLLLAVMQPAYPYGILSHKEIAIETIDDSDTKYMDYLHDIIGINENENYTYIDPENLKLQNQWYDLIYNGSQREDDEEPFVRPFNHFYDPNTNKTWRPLAFLGGKPTIEWALEPMIDGKIDWIKNQNYSLSDANDYLYDALTNSNIDERNSLQNKYFYSIGHILHLLADMGQPEHVRLDQHMAYDEDTKDSWEKFVNSLGYRSIYEKFTDENRVMMMNFLYQSGSQRPLAYPAPEITTARELFDGENGLGLAEFTNRNFVSIDTNFDSGDYPLPKPNPGFHSVSIDSLYNLKENNPYQEDFIAGNNYVPIVNIDTKERLTGSMYFVSSTVTGSGSDNQKLNDRASSYSIFQNESTEYNTECDSFALEQATKAFNALPACRKYTLNRWNFQRAHEFLVPTIVNYGKKLLEHLFRGSMDIARPYSEDYNDIIIDPVSGVITQLPVRIANTTPNESMGDGKLVAVISYVDTADNSKVVTITSDEIPTTYMGPVYQERIFKFSKGGFLLNMKGYTSYIQVVYRGQLGDETDNIVVARKPLSEVISTSPLIASLPESGTYAIADHSPIFMGFNKLNLNLSSSSAVDGIVVPVLMHRINQCYRDDLTGEYFVEGLSRLCDSSVYRSKEIYTKEVNPSSTILASNIMSTGQDHELAFPDPIPFSATDLMLVLYHFPADPKAPLGITFIDISEPTYISVINNTDYYAINGIYYSLDYMINGDYDSYRTFVDENNLYPTDLSVSIQFNGNDTISIPELPVGRFSRFAFLTTPDNETETSFMLSINATSDNFQVSRSEGVAGRTIQNDILTNTVKYPQLRNIRGAIAHYYIILEQRPLGLTELDLSTLPLISPDTQIAVEMVQ